MDFDKVFTAFRNCISEPKCKDCPWEQCEQFNQKKVSIPVTLALDVLNLLKKQEAVVRCKDCAYAESLFESYKCYFDEENESGCKRSHDEDFFCAYGKKRDNNDG